MKSVVSDQEKFEEHVWNLHQLSRSSVVNIFTCIFAKKKKVLFYIDGAVFVTIIFGVTILEIVKESATRT